MLKVNQVYLLTDETRRNIGDYNGVWRCVECDDTGGTFVKVCHNRPHTTAFYDSRWEFTPDSVKELSSVAFEWWCGPVKELAQ